LLKNLHVTGDPAKYRSPLARLQARLIETLPAEASDRVKAAVTTLQQVAQLRNSTFHDGSGHRAVAALATLGITYPVVDWSAAWHFIQVQVVRALEILRSEIQQAQG